MSHWSKAESKMKNIRLLKKALKAADIKFEEDGDINYSQSGRGQTKVEIKLDNSVGFQEQEDGTFSLVGDPWYSEAAKKHREKNMDGHSAKGLLRKVQGQYLKTDIEEKCKRAGFYLTTNANMQTINKDGTITLVATKKFL